jgi:hypothetical protein|nr:hypothetical protein [uncultured Pedobacter sp.]
METEITNLAQLQERIVLLKVKKVEDEIYFNQKYEAIKQKVQHPFKFVKDLVSSIAFGNTGNIAGKADWATTIGRIFFPMVLNKTVLKNSGVIIKTLVSLFSQRAINYSVFNKDVLSGWIDKATDFVKAKTKKEKRYGVDDYGIPPESETA